MRSHVVDAADGLLKILMVERVAGADHPDLQLTKVEFFAAAEALREEGHHIVTLGGSGLVVMPRPRRGRRPVTEGATAEGATA